MEEVNTNITVKTSMDDTLILTYGLTNKQMDVLKKEFDNVKDVSNNFLDLITMPAAALVIDFNKLNDDQVKEIAEAYEIDHRELNTSISLLYPDDRDDIPLYHTHETQYNTLSDSIHEIKKRLSIPEKYSDAKSRLENTIEDIRKTIEEPTKDSCYIDQISLINNGCLPYEHITTIMNRFEKLESLEKIPYRNELNCVLNATMIAFGIIKIEDIDFGYLKLYVDDKELVKDYVSNLAEMIKNHYEDNLKKNGAI